MQTKRARRFKITINSKGYHAMALYTTIHIGLWNLKVVDEWSWEKPSSILNQWSIITILASKARGPSFGHRLSTDLSFVPVVQLFVCFVRGIQNAFPLGQIPISISAWARTLQLNLVQLLAFHNCYTGQIDAHRSSGIMCNSSERCPLSKHLLSPCPQLALSSTSN